MILNDEEIEACRDAALKSFRRHQSQVRGNQISDADDPEMHLIWAIEAAILKKLSEQEPVLAFDGLTAQEFTGRELFEFQEATGCNTADEYKVQHPSPSIHEGWQPIETAPTNKQVLLAAEFDYPGDWRIKCGSFYEGEWHVWGASWMPTHWMPLPDAPKVSE